MKVYRQIIRSHRIFFILTLIGIFMAGLYTNMNLCLIWTKSDGGGFEVMIQRIMISTIMILIVFLNLFFLMREFLQVCIPDLSVLFLCGAVWREIIRKYMFALEQYGIPLIVTTDIFFAAVICKENIMLGILCTIVTWGIMIVFYLICRRTFAISNRPSKDFG